MPEIMSPPSTAKKKILIFCEYYLPSVKSGGGMWTVANLVDRFSDRYEFHIVTRNYDSPGDKQPFTSVKTGEWNSLTNCRVYYTAASDLTSATCARIVKEVMPDCVFLNSVFAATVRKFLVIRKGGLAKNIPVVLAPCGELSKGGLASKASKKIAYLAFAKFRGLYKNVIWKATTDAEIREIQNAFGADVVPLIAPDLTPKAILPDFRIEDKPKKISGSVRFIFLSRIVPKKNLLFFLRILSTLHTENIAVEIVGPQEDQTYWKECLKVINGLPSNITVNIVGTVSYLEGLKLLSQSHFFVLPTLNENFGYVFVESLAAGCPIVISDQTIWGEIAERNAGWEIPLEKREEWIRTLNRCIDMNSAEFESMATAARNYAQQWLSNTKIEDATAIVLETALSSVKASFR